MWPLSTWRGGEGFPGARSPAAMPILFVAFSLPRSMRAWSSLLRIPAAPPGEEPPSSSAPAGHSDGTASAPGDTECPCYLDSNFCSRSAWNRVL